MKHDIYKQTKGKMISSKGKPIKIVGISSGKRKKYECAREDAVSLHYLKLALKEAEKAGAKTELVDLHDLKINPCKECYSSCPAQCRFSEKAMQDKYSLSLAHIGKEIVNEIKKSSREYGMYSRTV